MYRESECIGCIGVYNGEMVWKSVISSEQLVVVVGMVVKRSAAHPAHVAWHCKPQRQIAVTPATAADADDSVPHLRHGGHCRG